MGRDLLAPGWSWKTEGRARASRHQIFSTRRNPKKVGSKRAFSGKTALVPFQARFATTLPHLEYTNKLQPVEGEAAWRV